MKKFLFSLMFVVVIIPIVGAQKPSKEEKAAIKDAISYAGSIAYMHTDKNAGVLKKMLNPKNIERPAFVFYIGDGSGLDAIVELWTLFGKKPWGSFRFSDKMRNTNLFDEQAYITFSGICVMLVPRNGSILEVTKAGNKQYDVDTLSFNFEEGKFYTIESRVDKEKKIEFSIKETDTEAYLAFQKANPNRFDGTWSGEKKNLKNSFSNQYSVSGNTMKVEGKAERFLKTSYVAEGRFMYNENTIIFIPEKAYHDGKEVNNFNDVPYVWYYTLTNNELHLEGGRPFKAIVDNNGTFRKID